MIRRPPRSTLDRSSAASDVYKRQSPLYALRQCFHDVSEVTDTRVYGVLSLIVWALTIVVTIKYVIVLMRADNRGEGGIFALTVLALRATAGKRNRWILLLGLVGGSLFYGDGVL